jgi:hypothetical protein
MGRLLMPKGIILDRDAASSEQLVTAWYPFALKLGPLIPQNQEETG